MPDKVPRLMAWLLRRRTEVLGDLAEERAAGRSRVWLWRQCLSALVPHPPELPKEAHLLSSLSHDVRYAARMLTSNPGFTFAAVFAVAIGVGVNAGIFMVLNGVAFKSLPLPLADRVVAIYQNIRGLPDRNSHGSNTLFSTSEFETYREQNHVFTAIAAYEPLLDVTLGSDPPRQLYGQLTSCNYFDALAETPALGRAFVASDCAAAAAVAVISDTLWRGRFAADQGIVGKKIILNRQLFTVIGVARPGFAGPEVVASSIWIPLTMQTAIEQPFDFSRANWSWLALIGRLKPDATLAQARADLGVIAARIDQATPGRATLLDVSVARFLGRPEERGFVKTIGTLVIAAVGMVLLIACANVANLLLARATGRQQEIAIRLSVGATRWRIVRQLLTESLLIALLGGVPGSILAFSTFQAIARFILSHLPRGAPELMFDVAPDWRVIAYSFGLMLLTGVVFGLIPALRASRPDVRAVRNSNGFLRDVLVGAQVAVCTILLVSAGLLLHGLWVAQQIDPGFDMNQVVTIALNLRGQGYSVERATAFQKELKSRLESLPGITIAAEARITPLEESHTANAFIPQGESQPRTIEMNRVSQNFLPLLGIPIVRGRNFSEAETRNNVPVAIVTESTAGKLWPGQDPLGKTLRDSDARQEREVIGVARDAQVSRIGYADTPYVYLPVTPEWQRQMQWMIRYTGGYPQIAGALRTTIQSLDPDLLISIAPLEDNLDLRRLLSRIVSALAGSLGTLALVLASIGIYGVVAFAVGRRVREIGIRMALGADRSSIIKMILQQAIRPVAIGGIVGFAGCAGVSKLLSSMLFGVSVRDPLTFLGVPALLAAVALAACYIPARRAANVDPMVALRYE